eukprot:2644369-Rhodomonas_salina.1
MDAQVVSAILLGPFAELTLHSALPEHESTRSSRKTAAPQTKKEGEEEATQARRLRMGRLGQRGVAGESGRCVALFRFSQHGPGMWFLSFDFGCERRLQSGSASAHTTSTYHARSPLLTYSNPFAFKRRKWLP